MADSSFIKSVQAGGTTFDFTEGGLVIRDGGLAMTSDQAAGTPAKGQIAFPATQNASTGVNVLDDYEEGSWTPALSGTGGTSGTVNSVQVGRYVKIGKLVHVQGRLTASTAGTITDSVIISGLPFTIENVTNSYAGLTVAFWSSMAAAFVSVGGYFDPNTTNIRLVGMPTAAATSNATDLVDADIANGFSIAFSGTYRASA